MVTRAPDGAWSYGDAHDRWPIEPGQAWSVGDHIVACGDLEGETPLPELLRRHPPDLMYVDPPWNAGNARSFRTKARSDGEHGRAVSMEALLAAVLAPARDYGLLAYVEMGTKGVAGLTSLALEMGARILDVWEITYYRRNPARLLAISWRGENFTRPDLDGLDDDHTPLEVLRHHRPDRVLDPCAGRGLTALGAVSLGISSISHELSRHRAAAAIERLREATGELPLRLPD